MTIYARMLKAVAAHKKTTFVVLAIGAACLGFCLYWAYYLHVAHSSFENYYAFRGCVELLEKTDTYGTCRLADGSVIKLVQVGGKWFLDGDLGWP